MFNFCLANMILMITKTVFQEKTITGINQIVFPSHSDFAPKRNKYMFNEWET